VFHVIFHLLQYNVRGEIEKFPYKIEGNGCMGASASNEPISVCAYAHHEYPENFVDILPWY